MGRRDNHFNIAPRRAISPVSVADNTPAVSEVIDMDGFESLEFVIAVGSVADADATFAVLVEDADEAAFNVTNAAVADGFLLGTEAGAAFKFDSDNTVKKIGYRGNKRYCRMTVTPTGNASAALMSVVAILGHPHIAPTA